MTTVVVLGGGPDAEREVSLQSASAVASALREHTAFTVVGRTIDRITLEELRAIPGDVVFPALHGAFGEGGPMQDLLELDGRAYVGSGPRASRIAMDKLATKLYASSLGVPTPEACVINPKDERCPLPLPVVVKPVHEGSSVGLHICTTESAWRTALAEVREGKRVYLAERMIPGRELTVGLLDGAPLPLVQITPAQGVYDYEAKYNRDDTQYIVDPELPPGLAEAVSERSAALARHLGVRHLARVDFMLDGTGVPWLIELNTMPGFTSHSLVPMAARARGIEMDRLCAGLVEAALRDHRVLV